MELSRTTSNRSPKISFNQKVEVQCVDYAIPNLSLLANPSKNLLAKFVNQMVASAFEFTADRLLKNDRGNAKATRARQISIYLMHTCLSFSLTEIGRIYDKDRTTIGHACRVIEDLRDEPPFDDRIIELEQTIQTVLQLVNHNVSKE